jgi:hypothetical protein
MPLSTSDLPTLPEYRGDVGEWASALRAALQEILTSIYLDLSGGKSSHRVLTSAPSANTLSEGEFVLVDNGASRSLVVKVNGTLRTTTLS